MLERRQFLVERRVQRGLMEVVASRQVQALQVGHAVDEFAKRSPQTQHLKTVDAAPDERREQRRRGSRSRSTRRTSAKVDFGFDAEPDAFTIASVSPFGTDLEYGEMKTG